MTFSGTSTGIYAFTDDGSADTMVAKAELDPLADVDDTITRANSIQMESLQVLPKNKGNSKRRDRYIPVTRK